MITAHISVRMQNEVAKLVTAEKVLFQLITFQYLFKYLIVLRDKTYRG